MRTRSNTIVERAGVNFVQSVVEGAGSVFKEVNLQHDFGHDATIVPVVNGFVKPREIALQIKSGTSYIGKGKCKIPASSAHIRFWADHDLQTLGVVYDPAETMAYWVDLRMAALNAIKRDPRSGTTLVFPKSLWNRFDPKQFEMVLLPTLLGEAPTVPLKTACEWVRSNDLETHDLGVRVIRARHYAVADAWSCLIDVFLTFPVSSLTIEVAIALSKLLGHADLGYYTGQVPSEVRTPAIARVLSFGPTEIAKLLALIDDEDFNRPSIGYSLMPLWGMSTSSISALRAIAHNMCYDDDVRGRAAGLVDWYNREPEWWSLWRRDGKV